jgi:hypothetical protein
MDWKPKNAVNAQAVGLAANLDREIRGWATASGRSRIDTVSHGSTATAVSAAQEPSPSRQPSPISPIGTVRPTANAEPTANAVV